MPTVLLPDNPNIDRMRRYARELQRRVLAGDPEAAALVGRCHPDGVPEDQGTFQLSAAQLVVARECGFPSWPRLKRYLDVVAEHGWNSTTATDGDPADQFCRLACLTYTDEDGPSRWDRARQLLASLPDTSIWAAAAAARPQTVRRLLDEDPALARTRGGPYRWRPLCYLAYSRIGAGDALAVARMLLDAGADPNEGYLWNGQPYPFTLLTGAFGGGERGQPAHPHSLALARLLLDAGADPNDGQTLYNRMFSPANDHLELLFEYGLGGGDGGPWKARIGELLDSPAGMLRVQLRWAIEHDMLDRVRLLVENGVDFRSPYRSPDAPAWAPGDGKSPLELAQMYGNTAIADYLVAQGAPVDEADPVSDLIAAAFRGDRTAVERLRPGVAEEARRARPGLMVWAAAQGRTETVALLAELGFDVNARGRGDAPVDEGWETALHQAAFRDDVEMIRLLLSLGADPGIHDTRFDATPLDWARYFNRQGIVRLLENGDG